MLVLGRCTLWKCCCSELYICGLVNYHECVLDCVIVVIRLDMFGINNLQMFTMTYVSLWLPVGYGHSMLHMVAVVGGIRILCPMEFTEPIYTHRDTLVKGESFTHSFI